uniref:Uncharacterized protein n=1 Tax=Anguilla anguilla TaxID=7936 RepID=A0A0E9TIG4_ANGAN
MLVLNVLRSAEVTSVIASLISQVAYSQLDKGIHFIHF